MMCIADQYLQASQEEDTHGDGAHLMISELVEGDVKLELESYL